MTDRATIEGTVRAIYEARQRGDVEGVMRHVDDDVAFCIAGCSVSSPVPLAVSGRSALRASLEQLVAAFAFSDLKVLDLAVEGERVFAHIAFRVRSPSGKEAVTEAVDLITFRGSKVLSYKQFADTALATRLLAA
ncbi:MAG: hypothetical protein JWR08_449 [Enterovirga sp.]|nr:hypothetical protein [Enterovirga sp.]